MRRVVGRAVGGATAVCVALSLSACGGGGSSSGQASKGGLTTITLGVPPVGDSLAVYVAIEKGYFKKEGLNVKLVPAANGATTINALISQSTDLALVSYPSLISAYSAGLPVTIAALAINGDAAYKSGLYVLNKSSIKTPANMLGKSMATPSLRSVGDVWFRGVLIKDGLDYHKVKFVEIPQANMANALKSGEVQGAFLTEPTLSAARKQLDLRAIGYQTGPQGLYATSDKTFKQKPKVIEGFRAALAMAVADIAADPHGVAEATMPKFTDMDAATAKAMNLPQYVTKWDNSGVQAVIDLMAKTALIKKDFKATELYKTP